MTEPIIEPIIEPMTDFILASQSPSRRALLTQAGYRFDSLTPTIDERAFHDSMADEPAEHLAQVLARVKAASIAKAHPDNTLPIVAGDQLARCCGTTLHKPENHDQLRDQLTKGSGQELVLNTACCVFLNGSMVWNHSEKSRLQFRVLEAGLIDSYIEKADEKIFSSVGGLQIEALGVHFFDSIQGDYFSILGLPLLALARFLRQHGIDPLSSARDNP